MNKSLIKKIIFYIFIIIIGYFFVKNIYINYESIKNYEFNINIYYLVLSVILQITFIFYKGYIWGYLIKGHQIKLKELFYIHSLTWLVRYIPGKASYIFSRILLLGKYDISKKQAFISIVYENLFQIIASFLIGIPLIVHYFVGGLSNIEIYLGILFIIIFIIFLYKPIFYFFLNFGLKLLKKEELSKEFLLNGKEIFKSIFIFSFGVILSGVSFFFMTKGIADISSSLLLPMIGVWSIAFVLGLLAIFSPNGIGVREGILVFFLQFYFPIEISIIISIFSRLWSTIGDGLFYIYALIYKVYFRKN